MTNKALEEELKERLHTRRLDKLAASFSGACISKGHCYSIDNDQNIFVKTNGTLNARVMFDGELKSLKMIEATKTIRVPKPVTVIHNFDGKQNSAFAMEFLNIVNLSDKCARSLGSNLANLHDYNNKVIRFNERASRWVGKQVPSVKHVIKSTSNKDKEIDEEEEKVNRDSDEEEEEQNQFSRHSMRSRPSDRSKKPSGSEQVEFADKFIPEPGVDEVHEFGFDVPTSCGSIPQSNAWSNNWVTFYARQRLDHTIRLIQSDHGDRELNEQWSHLQNKVDKFFSDFEHRATREGEIVPALLHGDLWSGNVAQLSDESIGVCYDPASFFGHSEYEFGIVRMFGGFSSQFEPGYFEVLPKKKLFEKRNKLYQLFHHLNHWNHFGSGYRSSSLSIIKDLNAIANTIK